MVAEIVDRYYSKCPHVCERAHFGAAQVVVLVVHGHGFPIEAAWQVEPLGKDVARIDNI
jgi:hypothetical protein